MKGRIRSSNWIAALVLLFMILFLCIKCEENHHRHHDNPLSQLEGNLQIPTTSDIEQVIQDVMEDLHFVDKQELGSRPSKEVKSDMEIQVEKQHFHMLDNNLGIVKDKVEDTISQQQLDIETKFIEGSDDVSSSESVLESKDKGSNIDADESINESLHDTTEEAGDSPTASDSSEDRNGKKNNYKNLESSSADEGMLQLSKKVVNIDEEEKISADTVKEESKSGTEIKELIMKTETIYNDDDYFIKKLDVIKTENKKQEEDSDKVSTESASTLKNEKQEETLSIHDDLLVADQKSHTTIDNILNEENDKISLAKLKIDTLSQETHEVTEKGTRSENSKMDSSFDLDAKEQKAGGEERKLLYASQDKKNENISLTTIAQNEQSLESSEGEKVETEPSVERRNYESSAADDNAKLEIKGAAGDHLVKGKIANVNETTSAGTDAHTIIKESHTPSIDKKGSLGEFFNQVSAKKKIQESKQKDITEENNSPKKDNGKSIAEDNRQNKTLENDRNTSNKKGDDIDVADNKLKQQDEIKEGESTKRYIGDKNITNEQNKTSENYSNTSNKEVVGQSGDIGVSNEKGDDSQPKQPYCGIWGAFLAEKKHANLSMLQLVFEDIVLGGSDNDGKVYPNPAQVAAGIFNDTTPARIKNEVIQEFQTTRLSDDTSAGVDGSVSKSPNNDFVTGLDDINKLFEGVDPPDELDVGASGSSLLEIVIGSAIRIVVKRVKILAQFTKKFASKFIKKVSDHLNEIKSGEFEPLRRFRNEEGEFAPLQRFRNEDGEFTPLQRFKNEDGEFDVFNPFVDSEGNLKLPDKNEFKKVAQHAQQLSEKGFRAAKRFVLTAQGFLDQLFEGGDVEEVKFDEEMQKYILQHTKPTR